MTDLLIKKDWEGIKCFFMCETRKHSSLRYILLLLIIVSYFIYATNKFGTSDGFLVAILTWSFFVLSTPIADAGFLIDFPVRLITKLRMVYSEMIVWAVAIILNILIVLTSPEIYSKTFFLKLFHRILVNPYPFWGIIILAAIGTFFSIYFGDELIDVTKHKDRVKYYKHLNKYKFIIFLFIIAITIILYNFLLSNLGIKLPLL